MICKEFEKSVPFWLVKGKDTDKVFQQVFK